MDLSCPHCDSDVFKPSRDGEKLKARTRILVLHKSGEVEINCGTCSKGILLPLQAVAGGSLRKADMPRFVLRKG